MVREQGWGNRSTSVLSKNKDGVVTNVFPVQVNAAEPEYVGCRATSPRVKLRLERNG